MCKYHINEKEKCIVNSKNGQIMRPSCIVDVIAMHSYLMGSGKEKQANQLLKDVFQGEKVITKLVESMQQTINGKTKGKK